MSILRFTRAFAGVAALALSAGRAARGQAQTTTPGATDTLEFAFTLRASDLSLWGPGSTAGPTARAQLFSVGLNTSTSAGERSSFNLGYGDLSFGSATFGGSFTFGTSGRISSDVYAGLEGGSLSFVYPARLRLVLPEPNTFGTAVPAVIRAEVVAEEGGSIVMSPPAPNLGFNANFDPFTTSIGGTVCFVSCSGNLTSFLPRAPLSLPGAEGTLIGMRNGWVEVGQQRLFDLSKALSDLEQAVRVSQGVGLVAGNSNNAPSWICGGFVRLPECDALSRPGPGDPYGFEYRYIPRSLLSGNAPFCSPGGSFIVTDQVTLFGIRIVRTITVAWQAPQDQCVLVGANGLGSPDFSFDALGRFGIEGTLRAPSFALTTTRDGAALVGTGDDRFVDLTVSTMKVLSNLVPALRAVRFNDSYSSGLNIAGLSTRGGISIDYGLIELTHVVRLDQEQTLRIEPAFRVTIALPDSWKWTLMEGGAAVDSGTGPAVLAGGQELHVLPPDPSPVNVTSSVEAAPVINNEIGFRATGNVSYRSFFGDVSWSAGADLELCCELGSVELLDWSEAVRFGPAFNDTIEGSRFDQRLLVADTRFEGDPIAGPALDPFLLDPENPIIAVATSLVNTSYTTGANHRTVTQTLVVENRGDVPLNATSVLEAVSTTGIDAGLIESVEITVNDRFDGRYERETLASGQTLPAGASATVTLRWVAVPGVHTAAIHAEGTSPIGTLVNDEAAAAFAWLDMSIGDPDDGPTTLNRRSQGLTPVHLLGLAALPVSAVDRTSLRVEGVAPTRINTGDENGDGIEDLVLLVPTQALLEALDARIGRLRSGGQVATAGSAGSEGGAAALLPVDVLAAGLLGGAISDRAAVAIDRAGNRNGRLDVGDLRVAALGRSAPVTGDGSPNGGLLVFVLSGTLTDGTTLWAEYAARIIGEAR